MLIFFIPFCAISFGCAKTASNSDDGVKAFGCGCISVVPLVVGIALLASGYQDVDSSGYDADAVADSCEASYQQELEKYTKFTQSENYEYPGQVVVGYVLCMIVYPIVFLICGMCCSCSCEERLECCSQAFDNLESNTGYSFSSSSSI